MILMGPKLATRPDQFSALLDFELHRFAAAGVTTSGDLAFEPIGRARRRVLPHPREPRRIRSYEISGP